MSVFVLVDKQEGLGKQYMYFNNNFLIDFILFFFFIFFIFPNVVRVWIVPPQGKFITFIDAKKLMSRVYSLYVIPTNYLCLYFEIDTSVQ